MCYIATLAQLEHKCAMQASSPPSSSSPSLYPFFSSLQIFLERPSKKLNDCIEKNRERKS